MSEIMTAFPNRLPRFGLRWNGPREFVPTPMDDGYWTPYHLAAVEIARLEAREDGYKAHIAKQAAEIADLHKLLQDGWVEVADGPVSRRALKERDAARAEADSLRRAINAHNESCAERLPPVLPSALSGVPQGLGDRDRRRDGEGETAMTITREFYISELPLAAGNHSETLTEQELRTLIGAILDARLRTIENLRGIDLGRPTQLQFGVPIQPEIAQLLRYADDLERLAGVVTALLNSRASVPSANAPWSRLLRKFGFA